MADFQKMQDSLLEYKQKAYDAESTAQKLKSQLTEAQNSRSSATSWFSSSSKADALQTENDNLRRSVAQLKEEFAQQTQALKGNLRALFEENEALRAQAPPSPPSEPTPDTQALTALQQQLAQAEEKAARLPALEELVAALQVRLREACTTPPSPPPPEKEREESTSREEEALAHQAALTALQEQLAEKETLLHTLQERLATSPEESETTATTAPEDENTPLPSSSSSSQDMAPLQAELESQRQELTRLQEQLDTTTQALTQMEEENRSLRHQIESTPVQEVSPADDDSPPDHDHDHDQTVHDQETAKEEEKNEGGGGQGGQGGESNDPLHQLQEDLAAQGLRFGEQLDALNEQLAQLRQENTQLAHARDTAQEALALAQAEAQRAHNEAAQAQEELALAQEDREAMITRLTEKELALDTLRDELTAQQSAAQSARDSADSEKKSALQSLQKQVEGSREQNDILKQEILALQHKLSLAEKEQERQQADMASNTEQVTDFQELVSLKSKQIQELRETIAHLRDQVTAQETAADEARAERALALEQVDEVRTALAQMSERHDNKVQALNAMAISKEEVVNQHRQVLDALRAEQAGQVEELRARCESQETELTQLRKEHRTLSSGHESSAQRLHALEEQVATLTAQLDEARTRATQWEKEATEAQASGEEARQALAVAQERIAEGEQKLQDVQMEHSIELKKSQRLIRDLQTRLQKAKDAPPPPAPATPTLPAARATSTPAVPPPASPARARRSMESAAATPTPPGVPQDVAAIGMKVGELQKRNFQLEEHIKQLRGTIQRYRKELDNKNRVIAYQHANLNPEGRSSAQMDSQRKQRATREQGLMGRLFGSGGAMESEDGLQNEINARMSRVLEDTILKNVQLQSDMEIMGDEIARLESELKSLREPSPSPSSSSPDRSTLTSSS